jgi:hypothetical protein
VADGVRRDAPELILDQIQGGSTASGAVPEVALHDLLETRAVLGRVDKRRTLVLELAFRFVKVASYAIFRMERHRSTSPINVNGANHRDDVGDEPRRSFARAPGTPERRRPHLMRHGLFVPSDTT